METSELIKTVEESLKKRNCKYVDLIAVIKNGNNNFSVNKGYVCYDEIEHDRILSYNRLRIKNNLN